MDPPNYSIPPPSFNVPPPPIRPPCVPLQAPPGPPFFKYPPPPCVPPPVVTWPPTNSNLANSPVQSQSFELFNKFTTPPPVEQNIITFNTPPPLIRHPAHASRDDIWLRDWMKSVRIKTCGAITEEKKPTIRRVKISEFKEKLRRFAGELKELESLSNCLTVLKKSLSEEDWQERKEEVLRKQRILTALKNEILNERSAFQNGIRKREKKRLRERKNREQKRKHKLEQSMHLEQEHKRIDMWLEKMKDEAERTKREEQVKLEADVVLSEVTQKKVEAKRTLGLLNTLTKLRNARVQSVMARGGNVSKAGGETFNQIIERLKKYWMEQLKEYNLEEQGLRVMLNDQELERSNVKLSLKKEILQQWNQTLFGTSSDKPSDLEPNSLEEFISVRRAWDKYVCYDDMVMSSSIPNGWVIPTAPSNEQWAKWLRP